jgi:prepilin-type N-terminal cleavage/methylation domain-containing protein
MRKGFSLVELLIVLAVIATLIAVATPLALNSIRKAKATAVANDLKTIAKGLTASVYLSDGIPSSINELGRNVSQDYGVAWNRDEGIFDFVVFTNRDVDTTTLKSILPNSEMDFPSGEFQFLTGGATSSGNSKAYYRLYLDESGNATHADLILASIITAMKTGSLSYQTFLLKDTSFNWGNSKNYNPTSWNGYLEKLLESGNIESNIRVTDNEGSNQIGYKNPYSQNGTVVNLPNIDTINWLNSNYPDYMPPAILITKEAQFDPSSSGSYIRDNIEALKGAMVFYKPNGSSNDSVKVYYIKEDGTLSELILIESVLPR